MNAFLSCCRAVGHFVHWLTGWIVHPKKGGCCDMDSLTDVKEKIDSPEKTDSPEKN